MCIWYLAHGKLVHKSMVENSEEVAQGLAVGTRTLDQLQGVNLTPVGLKRPSWEN